MKVVREGSVAFVEGPSDEPMMKSVRDWSLVVEACYSAQASCALLYALNMTPKFFDLSSGEAGEILQKLRTYRIRLAVVCAAGAVKFSTRFGEMVEEEKRTGYFGTFETVEAAREWLAGDGTPA